MLGLCLSAQIGVHMDPIWSSILSSIWSSIWSCKWSPIGRVELHMALHMALHMELHMGSIWGSMWADRRGRNWARKQNRNCHMFIYVYIRMPVYEGSQNGPLGAREASPPASEASDEPRSGEQVALNAAHNTG